MSIKPATVQPPLPPLELRLPISPITEDSYYDNPTGSYIWGPLDIPPLRPGEAYQKVFDFGCGIGREARKLLQQQSRPKKYVGVDVNASMIDWCQANLGNDRFHFFHLDAWNSSYATQNTRGNRVVPISQFGSDFTIIEANSVFTHIHADQSEFYLDQMRTMLAPTGIIRCTWFFFNKRAFPAMTEKQNTLFVDESDLTWAVYYDWTFFRGLIARLGYRIINIDWAVPLGHQNTVFLTRSPAFAQFTDVIPPCTSVVGY